MNKEWFTDTFDNLKSVAVFANNHGLIPTEIIIARVTENADGRGWVTGHYEVMYYAREKLAK
jgi:hypothetical protein